MDVASTEVLFLALVVFEMDSATTLDNATGAYTG
jgi:hypothetical protein